jgi:hypothetical protein
MHFLVPADLLLTELWQAATYLGASVPAAVVA